MKFLITGGEGYIGKNLNEYLLTQFNCKIDNYDIKNGENILNIELLKKRIIDNDVCIHLAALSGVDACEQDPALAIMTNIMGTLKVASLCHKYQKKLISISSFAAKDPVNIYGYTKFLGEKIVLQYDGTVARLSNVYGGNHFLELKNTLIAQLMKPNFVKKGKGNETRDFIHVDDVVDRLYELVYQENGLYEISSGTVRTVDEIIALSNNPDFPNNLREK